MSSSGKTIALIGNPGVGKTTFLIASIHHLDKIGWARIELKDLPREYGGLVDLLTSGQPLSPTLRLSVYSLQFTNVTYRGSELKMGWFGKVKLRVADLSGEEYRSRSSAFVEAVKDSFAVLLLMDPARTSNLARSLAGQVSPLVSAIKYLVANERDVKYIGLVFTKRFIHDNDLKDIIEFVEEQLGPILNYARRSGVRFGMFEVDSRGKTGKLEPEGLEPIYYDAMSTVCKVKGAKVDVGGTSIDTTEEDVQEEDDTIYLDE